MRLEIDSETGSIDIVLRDGDVFQTVTLDTGTLVDLDKNGNVLAIEIHNPESSEAETHLHVPTVRDIRVGSGISAEMDAPDWRIVCAVCGLLLDFRRLDSLGFNTSTWASMPTSTQ